MTTFHTPQNSASATVTASRAAGAATINVTNGAPFGSSFPVIVTAVRAGGVLCILEVTGVSGNVLTVSGAIEGTTDAALQVGDTLEMRPTALAITELQGAIHALENLESTTVYTSGSYTDPAWITGLSGSKIVGNISGEATSITGSIAESQVTGLTSDLAAKAPLASPALTGTPTAPTPATSDASTALATTAFVKAQGYLTPATTPTATNGQAVLASDFNITANYTYQDTGLSVSLPGAGTYLILANVRGELWVGGNGGQIVVQIYDTTAGAAVANSQRFVVVDVPGSSTSKQLETGYSWTVAATAATTIKLQAQRVPTDGTTTWTIARIGADGLGYTTLSYIRIA